MNQRLARLAAGVRGLSRIVISLNIPVPKERFVALRRRVLTALAEKLSAHEMEGHCSPVKCCGCTMESPMVARGIAYVRDAAVPNHNRLQKQPQPLPFEWADRHDRLSTTRSVRPPHLRPFDLDVAFMAGDTQAQLEFPSHLKGTLRDHTAADRREVLRVGLPLHLKSL